MASLLDAPRLAACAVSSAPRACALRPVACRVPAEQSRRLVAARAAATGTILLRRTLRQPEPDLGRARDAAVAESDAAAAKADDEFPDVAPEALTALPTKDKYAVVEIGGVQMFVQEGRWYNCNRLEAEPGQTIKLGRVLAVKQAGKFTVGTPYLEQASVTAEVIDELKAPKVTIFKMNSKKHYRKKTGHRQPLSQFYVSEIKL